MPNMKALVAALALTQLSVPVYAFNPTWPYDGFGIIGKPHVAMTEEAFNNRSKAYFNIENPSRTMKEARGQMKDGSAVVDHHGDAEAEDSKCHFDDENFFNSNGRLIDKKSEVVDALLADDLAKARNSLGRALHTLQDFYSHSNWVELGKTEISQNLGKTWPLEIAPAAEIDPLIPTCKDCSYTFSRARALDIAAEYRRLSLLGSVFIDPMGAFEKTKIIKCMFPDPLFEWGHCGKPGNLDIPAYLSSPVPHLLTSGWFGTKLKLHSDRPKGKCSHGGPFDRDADGLEGISKDTSHRFFSPHFDRHAEAADLALKATEKYFDDLRDILCTTGSGAKIEEKDCLPLKKLFGVGPPMAFTIDTTGSMGNVIASVRKDAIAIVNARRKSLDEPGYYVLSEINDPAPTSATVYFDPDSFIAAISRLGAFGGGDCPEYAMAGLANALDKMSSGGSIHLWTDAAAKDVALAQTITQRAEKKKVSIYTYLFTSGGCSTSEGFSFVSLGSGGQSFGDLSPSEAGNTANLAGSLVTENKVEIWKIIVNALNPFKLRHRAAGPFAYDIPVDSSMTVMTVSLSGTAVALSLFRPDGTEVKAGVADIVITTLSTGTIYTISKPATGLWKVTVSGKTGFSLSVFGTSTLQFDSFDFVESAGANHDGYFPVTSTPVPGTKAIGVAVLDGSFASADFEFRSTDGLFLGKLGLIHGTGDSEFEAPSNHFWGSLTVPSGTFNVYVSGKDTAGTPYQRVLPGILTPVPSNFTNPTNFTSSSTSMTPTAFLNSTTSFPATTSGSSGSTSGDHISSSCQPTPTDFVTTLTQ
jgi:von Willebrand factor A domain-containing protein 7